MTDIKVEQGMILRNKHSKLVHKVGRELETEEGVQIGFKTRCVDPWSGMFWEWCVGMSVSTDDYEEVDKEEAKRRIPIKEYVDE